MHSVPFGATDPVFHLDYSFFVFTLPAIDDFMGLLWGGVILGVLASIAMAVTVGHGDERPGGAAPAARAAARPLARRRAPRRR